MELRETFRDEPDLEIVYVVPDNQWNDKSARFVDGLGLRDRILFALDPGSAAIDLLGLRRPNTESIEEGVPHPSTFLLDRNGVIRLVDVREDYHIWLDSEVLREALSSVP